MRQNLITGIMKHRLGRIGFLILLVLYLAVILAGFLSPYHPAEHHRRAAYHPPTPIKFSLRHGLHVRGYKLEDVVFKRYSLEQGRVYKLRLFAAGSPYRLFGIIPARRHLLQVEEGGYLFLLGSDHFGRDVFARILYGGRVSLSIGLIGVAISFSLGLLVGGISGYFGGRLDDVLMRICEVIMSIPGFYLLLALRAVIPLQLTSTQTYLALVGILSFIGWPGLARVIRGQVLSIRERDFVTAAVAIGASPLRIIARHIIPNTFSYTIVAATLSIPGYILGESGLSFLGLGIQEPDASWGNMLSAAMSINVLTSFSWILVPGLFIFIAIMSFNLLGDAIRDVTDPRTQ